MLTIIKNLVTATRALFMNAATSSTPAARVQTPALTYVPQAGTFLQPREEILLDGLATIPAGATGRVIDAPSSFLLSDEVVVDWPVVGTIIHKLDTLADTLTVGA